MANKYKGIIGFVKSKKSPDPNRPGKYLPNVITEREYYIDVLSVTRRRDTPDQINDDFKITNRLSILMDPFVKENFRTIAYVEYMGVKWKIASAEIQYPRLILNVGGEYNNAKQA